MKKILIAFVLLSFSGLSQDTTKISVIPALIKIDPSVVTITEYTVSGERIKNTYQEEGKSVLIIDKEQLKNTPAVSVAEILVQHAGVDIRQRGANGVQADIGLRGSTFDQVLILLNGVRMSDAQTGHNSLNIPVDVSAIERIEIIKGAGARVYGQNSLAGVVNIITKNPKKTFTSLKLTAGDFNLWDYTVTTGLKTEKTSHLLSLNRNTSDGYKYNTDYSIANYFYSGELDAKEETKFNIYKPRLTWMAGFTEKKFGANGFYSSPAFKDQYEETQTSVASIKLNGNIAKNISYSLRVNWRRAQDEYVFLRKQPEVFRNHHINNMGGIAFNSTYKNKLGVTGFGFDISQIWIQSNNLGKRVRKIQTAFLEHKFSLLKNKLKITPGIQVSNYSDVDGVFLPGIDANFKLNKRFSLFATTGYTYRVPTYTDLYYVGRTNIGNPDLDPEVALSYEGGIRHSYKGITGQVSYFVREGNNIIDWTRATDTDPWQPNNLIKLNTAGIDLDVNIDFKKAFKKEIPVLNRLTIGYVNLSQTTTVDDGLLSKYALENLKNQVTTSLSLTYMKGLTHTILYRYSDRVNLDDYSIVDTKLSYDNGNILVFGEISNLLDQKYQETNLVIMPGRWFRIGVGYTFGNGL